jgi:hypothetical protein
MKTQTLEALVCGQDWIQGNSNMDTDQDENKDNNPWTSTRLFFHYLIFPIPYKIQIKKCSLLDVASCNASTKKKSPGQP